MKTIHAFSTLLLKKTYIFAIIILVTSCNSKEKKEKGAIANDSLTATNKTAPKPVNVKAFDINAIPVSDKTLGAFPYFALPEGYENQYPVTVDYDVAYFWVGDHFEKPQGKIFYSKVVAKKDKSYSDLELSKNIVDVIVDAGGVKIYEGKLDPDTAYSIPQQNRLKYTNGYSFIGYKTTNIYIIKKGDKNIWIQFTPSNDGTSIGWMVLETKPLKITASLIKADDIKKELDANGIAYNDRH